MNREGLFGYSKIGLGILGVWYGLASVQHLKNDQPASLEYAVESGVFIAAAFGAGKLEKRFRKNGEEIVLLPDVSSTISPFEEDSLCGGQGLESPDSQISFPPELE